MDRGQTLATLSRTLAEANKQLGMLRADQAVGPEWKDKVDVVIRLLAATHREFTAEDVRELAGDPPGHPNAMGARFSAARRAGLIRPTGYQLADRPSLHRHPIGKWVGVDTGAPASLPQPSAPPAPHLFDTASI